MSYWYVMRVSLGKERKLEERMNNKISEGRLQDIIRFVCPVEKEYYVSNNIKRIRDSVIYRGYLYVETENKLNKEQIEAVLSDSDMKGFLGTKDSPQILSAQDVTRIIKDEVLEQRIAEKTISINVDSKVKINEGAFIDFIGTVREINKDRNRVKVVVKIFERESIVDLSLNQIQKI